VKKIEGPFLLVDEIHGIHSASRFAEMYRTDAGYSGISDEELEILEDPDHDEYDDVWEWVWQKVRHIDSEGVERFLSYHEGNLFLGSSEEFEAQDGEW
jgi:hypothetical protein